MGRISNQILWGLEESRKASIKDVIWWSKVWRKDNWSCKNHYRFRLMNFKRIRSLNLNMRYLNCRLYKLIKTFTTQIRVIHLIFRFQGSNQSSLMKLTCKIMLISETHPRTIHYSTWTPIEIKRINNPLRLNLPLSKISWTLMMKNYQGLLWVIIAKDRPINHTELGLNTWAKVKWITTGCLKINLKWTRQ
jgi:hypothetical protein